MSDQTTDPYTPTRPLMTRDELATHKHESHSREFAIADDGYDDMALAEKRGWLTVSAWGRDGWDLGEWPYVAFYVRNHDGRFFMQTIVEGDHDIWAFDSQDDRHAAIDYLFLWYAAGKDWSPLTDTDRDALSAGTYEVPDVKWRGPYGRARAAQ